MLIGFKFSNYKSFKDSVEFSMEPLTKNGAISNAVETAYRKAPWVYSSSAIFGANASGKSNFIEAINYFQHLMESSYLKRLNESMELSVLSRIFNKLNRIRMYRNKIFHYGSLLVVAEENRPEKVHNLIYRMVGDLNAPKLLKELRKIDSFNEKYLKGKNLGILKR